MAGTWKLVGLRRKLDGRTAAPATVTVSSVPAVVIDAVGDVVFESPLSFKTDSKGRFVQELASIPGVQFRVSVATGVRRDVVESPLFVSPVEGATVDLTDVLAASPEDVPPLWEPPLASRLDVLEDRVTRLSAGSSPSYVALAAGTAVWPDVDLLEVAYTGPVTVVLPATAVAGSKIEARVTGAQNVSWPADVTVEGAVPSSGDGWVSVVRTGDGWHAVWPPAAASGGGGGVSESALADWWGVGKKWTTFIVGVPHRHAAAARFADLPATILVSMQVSRVGPQVFGGAGPVTMDVAQSNPDAPVWSVGESMALLGVTPDFSAFTPFDATGWEMPVPLVARGTYYDAQLSIRAAGSRLQLTQHTPPPAGVTSDTIAFDSWFVRDPSVKPAGPATSA